MIILGFVGCVLVVVFVIIQLRGSTIPGPSYYFASVFVGSIALVELLVGFRALQAFRLHLWEDRLMYYHMRGKFDGC